MKEDKKKLTRQEKAGQDADLHMFAAVEALQVYLECSPKRRDAARDVRVWLVGKLKQLGTSCPKFVENTSSKKSLGELAADTMRRYAASEKQKQQAKEAKQRAQEQHYPPTLEDRVAALEEKTATPIKG